MEFKTRGREREKDLADASQFLLIPSLPNKKKIFHLFFFFSRCSLDLTYSSRAKERVRERHTDSLYLLDIMQSTHVTMFRFPPLPTWSHIKACSEASSLSVATGMCVYTCVSYVCGFVTLKRCLFIFSNGTRRSLFPHVSFYFNVFPPFFAFFLALTVCLSDSSAISHAFKSLLVGHHKDKIPLDCTA